MNFAEDDFRMISELQHFAFCRRQWALIHLEQQWSENRLTAEGEVIHKNAHDENFSESRSGLITVRGLRVASEGLGVIGQCDVVEFLKVEEGQDGAILRGHRGRWNVIPIEYKRGREKYDECDELQLCCQALCLEEMLASVIPYGFIYYHEVRRRSRVSFTEELRQHVNDVLLEMHHYAERKYIPHVKPSKKCSSCSLKDHCLPYLQKTYSVKEYYAEQIREAGR